MDHLQKTKKKHKNSKKAEDSQYIYQKELDKVCFQHDKDYEDFKDLTRIKHYCIVIKHLILLKIQNMMDIKEVLLQWFINFLIENTSGGAIKMKLCLINN